MKNLFFVLAFLATPLPAFAQADATWCPLSSTGLLVNNKSLKVADSEDLVFYLPETRCGRDISSFTWAIFEIDFTHTTDGNVVLTCTNGQAPTAAAAKFIPQTCAGAGICTTLDAGIFSKAVTGNKAYSFRLGVRGYRTWRCVISHDNTPATGDLISIGGYLTD